MLSKDCRCLSLQVKTYFSFLQASFGTVTHEKNNLLRKEKTPVKVISGAMNIQLREFIFHGLRDEFRTFFITECSDLAVLKHIRKVVSKVQI